MAAGDLCSLAQVREFIQKPAGDADQDAVISSLISRASTAISEYVGREFVTSVTNPAARRFEYDWQSGGLLWVAPYDLQSVTQVRINADQASPTTLQSTEYRLFPTPNPLGVYTALRIAPYVVAWRTTWWLQQIVEITGTWGFPSVPVDVVQACVTTVAIWLRRDVAAFSTTFSIDEQSVERPEALPSAVRGLLDPYQRHQYV